ncbi:hypothetical protein [Kordiimonas marina]|uniref:hypothetical protein n=1 Tax=Kordiimonas marina TaxID=2872312 RepID=UPI001FF4D941|nr:hypothetical protein [Kordiimonas marina]MCJ9430188.1 hypothetical protein [Kordiimonas marina]
MVTLTSDAPVIAAFHKHKRTVRSRVLSLSLSLLILIGFVVFDTVLRPGQSLLASDRYHVVIWGLVIYGVYLALELSGLIRRRAYVEFTADQFRFGTATGEPDPWWRDVKAIEELGDGDGPKTVLINMTNGRSYRIDPQLVDFADTNIAALARNCWKEAVEKAKA